MAKDIEPRLKLISQYLKIEEKSIFSIPEYQRGYSWNNEQCDKLWQDIESFRDSDMTDPYFFGTIIVDCSKEHKYKLIDGQQRTTTFILLLKALLIRLQEVLKTLKRDDETEILEEGLKENRNKIIDILYKVEQEKRFEILKDWNNVQGIILLENDSINEQYKSELQNILEAKDFLSAENSCYKIPRKQKDNKYTNFFRNFKFFYDKLSQFNESNLNSFAKTFLTKCQIIEIRSWQIEQAITMFNSLNSTGMPLSDADIISAQLYSNAGTDKSQFNTLWENICKLSSELESKKIISIDSVLQQYMYIKRATTKEYMTTGSPDVTTPGLRKYYTYFHKELLEKPFELCNSFYKIAGIWEYIKDFPVIKLTLKFNENIKLYLISYLYRFDSIEKITNIEIEEISELLIRLFSILELVDTGYSSSNFKTFLFGLNTKLVDKSISIEEIKNEMDCHIKKNWNIQFIKEQISEYEKNILVFLNEYLYAKDKNLEFDFSESVTIEHIMPVSGQNLDSIREDAQISSKEEFDLFANKLGNKILLEENINKSIGREWFKTKKQKSIPNKAGYKDSKYNIALALVDYPNDLWTKDDIEKATNKVASRICSFIFG